MTPSIWKRPRNLDEVNAIEQSTLASHIGIEFTEVGPDYLCARIPVDQRTVQPMGILHGGASVALAETIGSVASNMAIPDTHSAVGLEINANHLRPAASGWVNGRCTPIHLGRSTHVWHIELRDDQGRLTCISRLTMAVIERSRDQVRTPPAR